MPDAFLPRATRPETSVAKSYPEPGGETAKNRFDESGKEISRLEILAKIGNR